MTALRVQPVVLAGGGGTRLWPLSRESYPKQFLRLGSGHTLLQQTLKRLEGLERAGAGALRPVVLCNEEHRFFVLHQAREIGVEPGIVLEPVGRNTAPALTVAALLPQSVDSILAMMPADHQVRDEAAFTRALRTAAEIAADGAIVMLGAPPDRPETGYGWIRIGDAVRASAPAFAIRSFEEKPDAQTAERLLRAGGYLWNCGIFVVKADVWLRAIRACAPEIVEACTQAVGGATQDGAFLRLLPEAFERCPSNSVDYAVMEQLGQLDIPGVVVPFEGGWSDVGSWASLWAIMDADGTGNVLHGDAVAIDSRNSAIHGERRLVVALGVDDLVIVETVDAVLVTRRDRAQEVKEIVGRLGKAGREEALSHRRVYRPWGSYETVDRGDRFQVKRIRVLPGHSLSLQEHKHRAEHWVVVRGTASVVRGEETLTLRENESTYIPAGVRHRLGNAGKEPLEIIEVQSGGYLGEDDIVRFEDAYDRK